MLAEFSEVKCQEETENACRSLVIIYVGSKVSSHPLWGSWDCRNSHPLYRGFCLEKPENILRLRSWKGTLAQERILPSITCSFKHILRMHLKTNFFAIRWKREIYPNPLCLISQGKPRPRNAQIFVPNQPVSVLLRVLFSEQFTRSETDFRVTQQIEKPLMGVHAFTPCQWLPAPLKYSH